MLKFRKASYEPGVVDFGHGAFAYLQPDGGWGFSNAGLVTDGKEALLIDTMFDTAHTRAMLDGFAKASSAKIGTLVNTHHNGDHCYGNGCLDCEIVATVGAAEAMKHETPRGLAQWMKAAPTMGLTGEYVLHCFGDFDFTACSVRAPDTTFTGRMTRQVGSKTVELIEVGPAHTGGDALVHVPADKTLFTGDILFIEGHPILWVGPVGNWIAACEMMEAMDVETIVPGHGPVTDKAGVRRVREYLTYIRDEAKKRYDSGMDALEAARSIALDDYAGWGDAERIAVNTATLYREFGSKDTPSDAPTMFGWMAQLWKDKKQ
ncbi:MAG: MBL fold metallo-hydrolase [Alphaproteobacteria bacterium]|nr:MBL fold metallo-hydrolase [Alphaproteobacteria bacterium]MBV9420094.1 MBL fold metallo-hydrolase [Alphaproteobacteria bacterium]MBV9903043.1 MBL fold metallo-hydrolase [Alphaproteobacteria bacterium]